MQKIILILAITGGVFYACKTSIPPEQPVAEVKANSAEMMNSVKIQLPSQVSGINKARIVAKTEKGSRVFEKQITSNESRNGFLYFYKDIYNEPLEKHTTIYSLILDFIIDDDIVYTGSGSLSPEPLNLTSSDNKIYFALRCMMAGLCSSGTMYSTIDVNASVIIK